MDDDFMALAQASGAIRQPDPSVPRDPTLAAALAAAIRSTGDAA